MLLGLRHGVVLGEGDGVTPVLEEASLELP